MEHTPLIHKSHKPFHFARSSVADQEHDKASSTAGKRESDIGICWLHPPEDALDLEWMFSIRGVENMYLYFWLLKDLSWSQDWYYPSYVFGSLAIVFSFLMVCNAVYDGSTNEVFTSTAVLLWIFANFWWMTGDIHDYVLDYPDDDYNDWYDRQTSQAAIMMETGISWLAFFYLIVKPLKLFGADDPDTVAAYDTTGLPPRWPFLFKTWREYENIHIVFWLGKDVAWINLIPSMWVIFLVPTFGIAWDMVFVTFWKKHLMVDHAHNLAILFWVMANALWAGGEIFDPDVDNAYPLGSASDVAHETLRWYSSWFLVAAWVPIAVCYALWIYYSCTGQVKSKGHLGHAHTPDDDCPACSLDHSMDLDGDPFSEENEYGACDLHRDSLFSVSTSRPGSRKSHCSSAASTPSRAHRGTGGGLWRTISSGGFSSRAASTNGDQSDANSNP